MARAPIAGLASSSSSEPVNQARWRSSCASEFPIGECLRSRFPNQQLDKLVRFLATLPSVEAAPSNSLDKQFELSGGATLRGEVLNESGFDAQVRTSNGRIHLLRRKGEAYVPAAIEPNVDWPTYHGSNTANRHSSLNQIDRGNVSRLAAEWFFPVPGQRMIEGTPIVIDGIMYVTGVNQVFALDAATGRQLWEYNQPRNTGLVGDAAIGLNRGVAIRGDLLFTVTDHAHAIALDRWTGELIWDVEMADSHDHYGAIAAPLVVGELVFFGISGGDTGLRGFLDAYYAPTGERAWRFWTIPAPGEPGSETWGDPEVLERGCGATWLTGSYDPELNILYWPTGNPCPDLNGDRRPGDNLYTNSVLALEPETGELLWYFQFTPHDTHDWDAQEPLLLLDEEFRGEPRKLLVQANRNGFLYVLDRVTGEFLLGEPFIEQTWADGLDENGRPIVRPGSDPTVEGRRGLPGDSRRHELVGLGLQSGNEAVLHDGPRVVHALHQGRHALAARAVVAGRYVPAGRWIAQPAAYSSVGHSKPAKQSGTTPQTGASTTYSGVLSTAGGLVFFGEDSGSFAALDSETGEPLWHFQANQDWKASPMTFMVGGRQFVSIASGMGFWAFALP